jgi:hypothetical protein
MSEIRYTVDESNITKLEKLVWYNNTRAGMTKLYGLNFDHFPTVTTESSIEEVDQIYDYMRFVINSRLVKEYIDLFDNRVQKYNSPEELINDPMSGIPSKRNQVQSLIMSNEKTYITEIDLFVTQNYSEEFIGTVDEMISESIINQ